MKTKLLFLVAVTLSLILNGHAQITAFTYQGRLTDNGAPAGGIYDFQFTIYDASANSSGNVIAGPLTLPVVGVTNGLFTATLDFGAGVFDGGPRWLEIGVRRTGGAGAFTTLVPRQPITATPYAMQAAGIAGTLPDGQLSANIARLSGSNHITGLTMFAPASGAPFRVSNTKLVANLNADFLDGRDSTAFAPATNSPSYVPKGELISTAQFTPQTLMDVLIPPGSIMAYMGTNAPPGWLLCDGAEASRSQYARLFGVIGTANGAGNGSNTFHLPDLRGMFLRGVDGLAGRDLDTTNRFPATIGGNTGNAVGSVQVDAFLRHRHKDPDFAPSIQGFDPWETVSQRYSPAPASGRRHYTSEEGGNETRPKNIYVHYIIKL